MHRRTAPTRIYVNGRFLTQATTGVQRYARETLNAIDASLNTECTISWTVLAPKGTRLQCEWKHIRLREVGVMSGHAWEQLELPRFASDGLLVTLCGAPSLLHRSHLFAIHDAALYDMPDGYSFLYRTVYRLLYATTVDRCLSLFTVSEFSRKRLALLFPRAAGRIVNTYCGVDHFESGDVADPRSASGCDALLEPYALAVSSLAPNKNFKVVVALSKLLSGVDLKIAVVGGINPRIFTASSLESPTVMQMGYVSDAELKNLYRKAACFIFPSLYEGFGLPPIEAMSFGCPVIASNATSIPEVCGEAALYFDPGSAEDLDLKLKRLLHEPKLAESLRGLGYVQSKKYTWERVAKTILQTIESIMRE